MDNETLKTEFASGIPVNLSFILADNNNNVLKFDN